jgi:hypothetical protein
VQIATIVHLLYYNFLLVSVSNTHALPVQDNYYGTEQYVQYNKYESEKVFFLSVAQQLVV